MKVVIIPKKIWHWMSHYEWKYLIIQGWIMLLLISTTFYKNINLIEKKYILNQCFINHKKNIVKLFWPTSTTSSLKFRHSIILDPYRKGCGKFFIILFSTVNTKNWLLNYDPPRYILFEEECLDRAIIIILTNSI